MCVGETYANDKRWTGVFAFRLYNIFDIHLTFAMLNHLHMIWHIRIYGQFINFYTKFYAAQQQQHFIFIRRLAATKENTFLTKAGAIQFNRRT